VIGKAMKKEQTALLLIDPQYDFCNPKGSLYVPGAENDIERIAQLISLNATAIDQIFVTLDTHHVIDIAHPLFWKDPNGNVVAPFTLITLKAVQSGKWIPRFDQEAVVAYLTELEAKKSFKHFIWPEHCLIGSQGASIDNGLLDSILAWTHQMGKDYIAIPKGLNPMTEHFGVFKAQISLEDHIDTQLNQSLINQLEAFDRILIAGEARSHCVATSIQQILHFAPQFVKKSIVLTDCMSDVPNWGYLADPIFELAEKSGMIFTTSSHMQW
jgi:nicotinamidase/pyrazinamidase